MARHSRHRYAPLRSRARDGARAQGVRRLITTPTFALGLAVLIAAVLAFGTTQTYLRFSGSGGPGGCGATGCANPAARPNPGAAKAGHAGGPVQITYTTLGRSATGFTGQLLITNTSGSQVNGWHLFITYKSSHITHMTGAQWIQHPDSASGTLRPAATSGPMDAGKTVRISYTATGNAQPPSGCTFNGTRCHIRSAAP